MTDFFIKSNFYNLIFFLRNHCKWAPFWGFSTTKIVFGKYRPQSARPLHLNKIERFVFNILGEPNPLIQTIYFCFNFLYICIADNYNIPKIFRIFRTFVLIPLRTEDIYSKISLVYVQPRFSELYHPIYPDYCGNNHCINPH